MLETNTPQELQNMAEFREFIYPICEFLGLNLMKSTNPINYLLYNSYKKDIVEREITPNTIINFMKDHNFLVSFIKNRKYKSELYNQPIIRLVYYLIYIASETAKEKWFFTPDEIIILFTDLGISSGLD